MTEAPTSSQKTDASCDDFPIPSGAGNDRTEQFSRSLHQPVSVAVGAVIEGFANDSSVYVVFIIMGLIPRFKLRAISQFQGGYYVDRTSAARRYGAHWTKWLPLRDKALSNSTGFEFIVDRLLCIYLAQPWSPTIRCQPDDPRCTTVDPFRGAGSPRPSSHNPQGSQPKRSYFPYKSDPHSTSNNSHDRSDGK